MVARHSSNTGLAASGSYTAGANGRFTGSLTEPSSINGVFYVLNNKNVNNSIDNIIVPETDTATPGIHLSQVLACRGLIATSIPNPFRGGKGLYGGVQFELLTSHSTDRLNFERTVFASNDGGKWVFGAVGTVQTFEETEAYSNRRIVDRFTPDMLRRYCHALGANIDSREFYGNQSVLEVVGGPLRPRPGGWPSFSLQQVRKSMDLEPDTE